MKIYLMAKTFKAALTVGVFDCFHEGHLNVLQEAKEIADDLIVIIHDDYSTFLNKKRFTVQPLKQRIKNLKKTGMVKKVYIAKEATPRKALKKAINRNRIDVYIRGNDWVDFPGKEILKANEILIRFIDYTKGVSTTKIRNKLSIK